MFARLMLVAIVWSGCIECFKLTMKKSRDTHYAVKPMVNTMEVSSNSFNSNVNKHSTYRKDCLSTQPYLDTILHTSFVPLHIASSHMTGEKRVASFTSDAYTRYSQSFKKRIFSNTLTYSEPSLNELTILEKLYSSHTRHVDEVSSTSSTTMWPMLAVTKSVTSNTPLDYSGAMLPYASYRLNSKTPHQQSVLTPVFITTSPNMTITPTKSWPHIIISAALQNAPGQRQPICAVTGDCCQHGLHQLPTEIQIKESLKPGSVVAEMHNVSNISIDITIVYPQQIAHVLPNPFRVRHEQDVYKIELNRQIDLEELYLKLNKNIDVQQFRIQLDCLERDLLSVSKTINISVEDVDDAMPEFDHQDSHQACLVPVYKAATSEHYTGHLEISPRRIRAIDGDISQQHRILYKVLHAEPDNYLNYFYLDQGEGTLNKTRIMNASDPRKYVVFVQAVEDSANQKARVAILSIEVYAPLENGEKPIAVDPAVKYTLQILSALVLIGFVAGFIVIVHHRYRRRNLKVACEEYSDLAMFKITANSTNGTTPDIPAITSPSQVAVLPKHKKKLLIVKKPLDTKARPGWNAPLTRVKKTKYNPYFAVQRIKNI